MVKKASKRPYIIRVLYRCSLPPDDLLLVYFSAVRSVLEYACPVWRTMLPKYQGEKTEKSIFASYTLQQTTKMPLTWRNACKRLDNRHSDLCASAFKEIQKPYSCLNHLLPPFREESHNRDHKNKSNFLVSKCRSERLSFIPSMVATLLVLNK